MYRIHYLIAAIVILVSGGTWLFSSRGEAKNGDSSDTKLQAARPIPTAIVLPFPKMLTREFPAMVRANKRVQLAFSVPGLLQTLEARTGRVVRKGEVIAQLDPRDYQNALDVAKANFVEARLHFNRTKMLRKDNVVPQAEFDRADAAMKMAAAELRIREKALTDTVLRAPFDGIIATRFTENFEHIQAKAPIVSIQDISVLEVVLQVSERLVAHGGAKSLQNIKVHLDADGGRWFDASVQEFSVEANPVTRTYELVLGMQPPKDIKVFPGMTATVRAEVLRENQSENWNAPMTLVPAGAVVTNENGEAYVWLIEEKDTHPQRMPVVIGVPIEDGMMIRSGLQPGQRIATAGVHTLDETMLVRPMREHGEGLDG